MLLLACALLPTVLGGAMPFLRIQRRKGRMIYAVSAVCLTSVLVFYCLFQPRMDPVELFRLSDRFVCRLALDQAGKVYLGLAALLWPFAALYAVEYMRHEAREGNFFAWYTVSFGAAILMSAANNLFTLYIFYEWLTLCTVPLVWHRKDGESTRAAVQYMLYLIGGAALGFAAVMLVPAFMKVDGTFCLGGAGGYTPSSYVDPRCVWIVLLGFLGFGVKAAVLPLCRWLPTASVAPTPVTALLHAVAVVNAGVFAVARVLYYTVPNSCIRGTWAQTVMLILSTATILYGAVMAVREQQVKKRLAWSTVSNLSYMLFGLSLLSESGMAAGMAHMVFHGLMKIILFYCAGAVLVQTDRTQVRQMQGLGRKMPLAFGCFTLAGLSLVGIPPLPGFVSKYALVTAAFEQQGVWAVAGAVALLIAAVLTTIYIFTIVYPAFFMEFRPIPGEKAPRDGGVCMTVTLVALSGMLLLAGIFAGRFMEMLAGLAQGVIA